MRYFVDANGRIGGEVLCDVPANPDELLIIEWPEPLLNPSDYRYVNDVVIHDPVPVPEPTLEQRITSYKAAVQKHLDDAAKSKGYDDIVSACSYAGYANDFRAEGESFGVWRAACWKYCYAELDKVVAGQRAIPTIEQILSELPARVIP